MTETVQAVESTETVQAVETVQLPKSVAARNSRKRFSFGAVWNAAVIAGKASDTDKLVAQGVKLGIGTKSDLKRLKLLTLRQKVAAKLQEPKVEAAAPAETAAA